MTWSRFAVTISGWLTVTLAAVASLSPAVSQGRPKTQVLLVWHVETADGRPVDSHGADEPVNPASVIKIATSLWALERLGPRHRFETRFGYRGAFDRKTGVLEGDLIVDGDGDPDLHWENLFLVARALNEAGLRVVTGSVLPTDRVWIGWEGGSARREPDAERRRRLMAERLRTGLDPQRWNDDVRRSIGEFRARRTIPDDVRPQVRIEGRTPRVAGGPVVPLAVHRSNPLVDVLKRFNAYSNNDIERLEASLGPVDALAAELRRRWSASDAALRIETYSGLGSNRMTPRLIVRLLSDLEELCDRLDIALDDVLPVAGCDPGTLESFSALSPLAGRLTAKTGTLVRTDDGVVSMAGSLRTLQGDQRFAVVAPRARDRLIPARHAQQDWLLDLDRRAGGGAPYDCSTAVVYSDHDARVMRATTN